MGRLASRKNSRTIKKRSVALKKPSPKFSNSSRISKKSPYGAQTTVKKRFSISIRTKSKSRKDAQNPVNELRKEIAK
jgi:hypothetical protein